MSTNVIIVEDDKKYSDILKRIIESDQRFACIAQYYNAQDALEYIPIYTPTIVLLDIQLPDFSGIELLAKLKPQVTNTHFVMCTSYDDDEKVFESLKHGAAGYISKSDDPDSILHALIDITNGGAPMSTSIAKKVVSYFYKNNSKKEALTLLNDKENSILEMLSQGLLYKEIASKANLTIDSVKKNAGSIYKKLHVCNKTEAINVYLGR